MKNNATFYDIVNQITYNEFKKLTCNNDSGKTYVDYLNFSEQE